MIFNPCVLCQDNDVCVKDYHHKRATLPQRAKPLTFEPRIGASESDPHLDGSRERYAPV